MRIRRCFGVAMIILTCVTFSHARESPDNTLPEAVKKALKAADSVEVVSLDPGMRGRERPKGKRELHGWKVLGSTKVTDKAAREKLAGKINVGVDDCLHDERGLCFSPRHAVRVAAGGKSVDLVICFECNTVKVFETGKHTSTVAIKKMPEKFLDELLTASKVPLAAKPKREDN